MVARRTEVIAQEPVCDDSLRPGTSVGEYTIEARLGVGGMSEVYAACHPLIGKRVAVKVLGRSLCRDPQAIQRFVGEAQAINRIHHPNIVDVFGFGTLPDGRQYILMELQRGETLARVCRDGPLPIARALEIIDQIADALIAVHQAGVVHRDIKPANVFVAAVSGGRDFVKLLDFGIAKLTRETLVEGRSPRETESGVIMGTPGYTAPECFAGAGVDRRADIYALGVLAFELLVGAPPFTGANAAELLDQHRRAPPPRPSSLRPEIPPPLDAAVLAMLAKDPAERPTLADLRAAILESRTATRPSLAPLATVVTPRPRRRAPVLAAGVVLALLAGLAAVGVIYRGRPPIAPPPLEPPVAAMPVAVTVPPIVVTVPAVSEAKLVVVTDPAGAKVSLDGAVINVANRRPVKVAAASDHLLTVDAAGYASYERKVRLEAGQTLELQIRLVRKPVRHAPARANRPARSKDLDYTVDPFSGP